MVMYNDWMRHDQRDIYALIRYILFRCCKKDKNGKYIPLDYMQVKWIIDRCNYLYGKWYNLEFISYEIFNWWDELDFIPETFDCDWTCDYLETKKGKLKKIKNKHGNIWKEQDFWRPCCIEVADKIIKRWKLYGKTLVKIINWWYNLKWRFKKNESKF